MAKSNSEGDQNITNKKIFLVQDPDKGNPVTPCMDVYKEKIQSDGSLYNIKLIIVIIRELQNKELVVYTWSQTASMRNLK